jgi:hypothetical protein
MDSLRKIEEDLRNLGVEFKKKYPEITDATERALNTLKTMREMYVADKMRKTGLDKEDVKIPQSSDITAPYLLACNYIDANPKLILVALNGIQLIVTFEVVPLSDVKSILRVFAMQAATGKPELQLKILQILGQLVTIASRETALFNQHFNEETVKQYLALTLSFMCEAQASSLSVSSTALATSRQVIATMLDGIAASSSQSPSSLSSVVHLVEDLCLFIHGKQGEWNRGLAVPPSFALDILDFMLSGWKQLFSTHPKLLELAKVNVFSALKPRLQNMQSNFSTDVTSHGVSLASAQCYKVVRLARSFLLDFTHEDFMDELDIVITLMIHCITSDLDSADLNLDMMGTDDNGGSSLIGAGAALFGGIQGGLQRLTGNSFGQSPRGEAGMGMGGGGSKGQRTLRSCYLVISSSTSYTEGVPNSASDNIDGVKILSHPAGLCLEALLSFFMSDVYGLVRLRGGSELLVSSMINSAVSASTLLSKALSVPDNVAGLSACLEAPGDSPIAAVLEDALSGKGVSVEATLQSIHERVGSSNGERVVSGEEVLILSLYLLQVIVRRLLESTIDSAVVSDIVEGANSVGALFVVGHSTQGGGGGGKSDSNHSGSNAAATVERRGSGNLTDLDMTSQQLISEAMNQVCVGIYESVQEACMSCLSMLENAGIVRRNVGILSEVAIVAGVWGHERPCEVIISSLCRYTVPKWHGFDSMTPEGSPHRKSREGRDRYNGSSEVFRWRHVQATVRLLQSLHVLADRLSDWDSVVDALEQIVKCLISPRLKISDEVTSADVERILLAIDRFKEYTAHLSDDSIIKLMSSLVAMSLNTLAVTAKSNSSSTAAFNERQDALRGSVAAIDMGVPSSSLNKNKSNTPLNIPPYMVEGISQGIVSFSLQSAVEVTKVNSFRIACIWQMVTSHLRMVSSLKNEAIRAVAVHATHDMILSVLKFVQLQQPPSFETVALGNLFIEISMDRAMLPTSDEVLFSAVMPSLQTCFMGRQLHKAVFRMRAQAQENNTQHKIELSQSDVLNCLRILSAVRCDDVKVEVMQGLLGLLQGSGDILNENGWESVVSLLALAPQSLCEQESGGGTSDSTKSLPDAAEYESNKWPRDAMELAFTCMKLIVDEYIEVVSVKSVRTVIECCATFSEQQVDVNISLTALEMLWKVYDQMMRTKKGEHDNEKKGVFDLTMRKLLTISTDSRPEIRNCATNTLFAALTLTSNASLTSGGQWRQIFDQVIFPLFEMTGERSHKAMQLNEAAIAPELKKGTKMVLHHSRDTAHKQWSETRLLALRGLTRVINTCTASLITEAWFQQAWMKALNICKWGSHASLADMEVAIGSVDALFGMLKMVSVTSVSPADHSSNSSSNNTSAIALQRSRKELWLHTWSAVADVCKYDFQAPELAMHLVQCFHNIYATPEGAAELQKAGNLSTLCLSIITLARPRLIQEDENDLPKKGNSADQLMLMRSIGDFVQALKYSDEQSRAILSSAMIQLCFSGQFAQCVSPVTGLVALLDACPVKFREDMKNHFTTMFLGADAAKRSPAKRNELIDSVFGIFIGNVCGSAIALRSEVVSANASNSPSKASREPKESKKLGFFSFLSGPLDEEFGSDNEEEAPQRKDAHAETKTSLLSNPLTAFEYPKRDGGGSWTSFYSLGLDISVLTRTIEEALANDNLAVLPESTTENIFSSLLCVLSPWKVSELPGLMENPGTFLFTAGKSSSSMIELLTAIYSKCDLNAMRSGGWIRSLIEVIFIAVRLQIIAISHEITEGTDFSGVYELWTKMAEMLSVLSSSCKSPTLRRKAITALLEISKDFSLQSLAFHRNTAIISG